MVKWIGAGLVFAAGTMLGWYMSHQYASRPRHIRTLIQALQRLETEITFGLTPLPEALRRIAEQTAEPVAAIFRRAAEELDSHTVRTADAWQTSVRAVWGRTAMKESERDIVLQLGYSLGASDRLDQIKHLRLAMNQLQCEEENAADEQRRYAKMWRSLGMLGGALVVILMF